MSQNYSYQMKNYLRNKNRAFGKNRRNESKARKRQERGIASKRVRLDKRARLCCGQI